MGISSKQMCPINLLSDGIPGACPSSDTVSVTIPATIYNSNPEAIPNTIPDANSDHSHHRTMLQEGGLRQWLCEPVGENLSSWYVAQVNLSISSHICSKMVLGCNVCNWSSAVDSVLDARDRWLWIREHVRDRWDAKHFQKMGDLCKSDAVYSKGIVLGISHGLGSRLVEL
jgi:hypothetical protein